MDTGTRRSKFRVGTRSRTAILKGAKCWLILLLALPVYGQDRQTLTRVFKAVDREYTQVQIRRQIDMGAAITTKWTGGTSGDAALRENWDVGLPRSGGDTVTIPKTTTRSITSNFGSKPAFGTLTLVSNVNNADTIVIDSKTYTFDTSLSDTDGHILIGGSASATIDNLIAGINLTSGAGSTYAASMTVHPTAYATAEAGDTMDAIARTAGTAGNSLVTTESTSTVRMTWTAGTMAGGAATGLIVNTLFVEDGYTKDIMTSGTGVKAFFTAKIDYKGSGTLYLQPPNFNDWPTNFVCDSPNTINAVVILGTVQKDTMEIVRGKVVDNSAGLISLLFVLNSTSAYEAPSSSGTITIMYMTDGTCSIGATISTLHMDGGELTKTGNALTDLNMNGGNLIVNSLTSGGDWRLLGGVVDARGLTDVVTLSTLRIDESKATLLQNKDFNTWITRIIGD